MEAGWQEEVEPMAHPSPEPVLLYPSCSHVCSALPLPKGLRAICLLLS